MNLAEKLKQLDFCSILVQRWILFSGTDMKNLLLIFLFHLIDHLFLIPTTPHFWKSGEYCPSYEHLNSGHFCEFQLGWWRHWHNTNSSIRLFVLKFATLLIGFMRFIYDEITWLFSYASTHPLSVPSWKNDSRSV